MRYTAILNSTKTIDSISFPIPTKQIRFGQLKNHSQWINWFIFLIFCVCWTSIEWILCYRIPLNFVWTTKPFAFFFIKICTLNKSFRAKIWFVKKFYSFENGVIMFISKYHNRSFKISILIKCQLINLLNKHLRESVHLCFNCKRNVKKNLMKCALGKLMTMAFAHSLFLVIYKFNFKKRGRRTRWICVQRTVSRKSSKKFVIYMMCWMIRAVKIKSRLWRMMWT